MKLPLLTGLLVLFCATPGIVGAQVHDARVLPQGIIRLHIGASSAFFDSRFGSPIAGNDAEREPLATGFQAVLVDTTFTPISTLQQNLNFLFEATDTLGAPFRANSENLLLTVSDLRASAEIRTVPFGLDIGLLPGVNVGVRIPLVSYRLNPQRLGVSGGTVGLNPDPAYNRMLLMEVDSVLATTLGSEAFLPTRGSAVGQALQERVRAATDGQELRLPNDPLADVGIPGFAGTDRLGTGRYNPSLPQWEIGDTEISAKVQFLNTVPGHPYPERGSGAGYRGAVEAGIRLPTGQTVGANYRVLPIPEQGVGGAFVRLYNDFFVSPRFWLTGTAGWEQLRAVEFERRIAGGEGEVTTGTVRWEPGTHWSLALSPRFRLVEEIALVASYLYLRTDGESYTVLDDGGTDAPSRGEGEMGTAQQWSAGIEFSTLAPFLAGDTTIPLEASVLLRNTFAGSGGTPAVQALEVRGSLFYPLWGN